MRFGSKNAPLSSASQPAAAGIKPDLPMAANEALLRTRDRLAALH